jgi:hypothetical protein
MVHFISTMLALGAYLIYVCSFHSALPKYHGVFKKTLISHSVLAVLMLLLFLIVK